MAVAVTVAFQGPGATLENYIKSLKILGTVPEGKHPDEDCLFHWVTEAGGGLHVTDVWTSKAEFEDFVPKVQAAAAELGMPDPDVKFIDVANFLTAAS